MHGKIVDELDRAVEDGDGEFGYAEIFPCALEIEGSQPQKRGSSWLGAYYNCHPPASRTRMVRDAIAVWC